MFRHLVAGASRIVPNALYPALDIEAAGSM